MAEKTTRPRRKDQLSRLEAAGPHLLKATTAFVAMVLLSAAMVSVSLHSPAVFIAALVGVILLGAVCLGGVLYLLHRATEASE
jgi:hypothetical protein